MEAAHAHPATDLQHPSRRVRLGALLVRERLLTQEQLDAALEIKADTGGRLGEIVVEKGWVTSRAIAQALASQHGLEYVDLGQTDVDDNVRALLPERLARRYRALPVRFVSDEVVLVAVADPTDVIASDDLRLALGMNVRLAVADPVDIDSALARLYRLEVDVDGVEQEADGPEETATDIREFAATTAPAIKLVNSILSRAIEDGASDIHFEPQDGHVAVRARIDGVTRLLTTIPRSLQPAVTSRLKIMADLDIAERRLPQDGRVSIRFGGHPMDLRIAVLPTTFGEQVVLRIANRAAGELELADLGMSPDAERAFREAISQPYGAVLACGPTGSGKTTTLYAALGLLNSEERVLMTIEDPVERQLPRVNQVEVATKAGLTFARGLRTILRSDPDVLLVGEIRDEETARIAIQAAMTGHLVLTTLHTHNAAGSVARLKDMGIQPNLLATSINCIVAQRLARRLCEECREPYYATVEELARHGVPSEYSPIQLFRPRGCLHCAQTGYRGRVALYEVMSIQGKVRRLLGGSTEEIFAAAVEDGMTTLREDGIRQALAGITALEEVERVTGNRLI